MSDCGPPIPPIEPGNPPSLTMPGDTIFVTGSEQAMVRTDRQETDALGAMRRALKDYLASISKDISGERVQLVDVFEEWATSEDAGVRYPSAAVLLADGTVTYDASSFGPVIYPQDQIPGGAYIVKLSEATTEFVVEVHCDSPGSRLNVSIMLEEALTPVDWMYGFQLDCPYYFGQRAQFALISTEEPDDATSARHGLRVIRARLMGQISVVRPRKLPFAQPKIAVGTIDSGPLSSAVPIARGRL